MKKTLLLSYVFMFSFLFLMASTTSFAATISVVSDTTVDVVGVYNKAGGASNFEATAFPAVVAAEPAPYSTVYTVGALNSTWDNGTGLYFQNTNPGATWIWETERAESPSTVYAPDSPLYDEDASKNGRVVKFEKKFNINGIPTGGTLHITADNAYEVWINGNQLPRPATAKVAGWESSNLHEASVATSGWQTVGHLVIPAGNFVNGENTITILAGNEYYFNDDGNNPVPAYVANPYRQMNPGALIFKLDADYTPVSPLEISKTVETSFDRDWTWTIEKSLPFEDDNELELAQGENYKVDYLVKLDAESVDSNWQVFGTITIHNPNEVAADITNIIDSLGTVVCLDDFADLSGTLAAGGTLECTYSGSLPNGDATVNVATVDTSGDVPGNSTEEIPVIFGDPTIETDECVTVNDTYDGLGAPNGNVKCVDGLIKSFSFGYPRTITPQENQACDEEYLVENTASFVANDTQQNGSDDLTITVVVPCLGCTLTQGYWKNHSQEGKAPYDDGWKAIGVLEEDTLFFKSGKTWLELFRTPPKGGNAYIQLAHQYMAAKLNVLNGATPTLVVTTAINNAETLFNAQGVNDMTLTKIETSTAKGLAGTLGSFNEGAIGPGHCDENAI